MERSEEPACGVVMNARSFPCRVSDPVRGYAAGPRRNDMMERLGCVGP